jgi:predicted TPR repeat methyltransferase
VDTFAVSSGDLIADRRYRFGRDLAARGDFSAAADLFAQAIEAAPRFAPAWLALGEARARLGDKAGAAGAFQMALQIDPQDHYGAALHLARLGAADAAQAMSPAYLRTLFDQYAPRFDDALESLGYRAPSCLRDAVETFCRDAGRGAAFGEVLDLGCGTGLAGASFRPLARRLTGIDLSPAMIAQARGKQIYDRLETGDLLQFLAAENDRGAVYDLVIAADVFNYLFDLAPAVAAVASVLGSGGLFAFTVEAGGEGVELGEKLRYRHGADHLRAALAAAALRLEELSRIATRTEAKQPVPGLLALATRADDTAR